MVERMNTSITDSGCQDLDRTAYGQAITDSTCQRKSANDDNHLVIMNEKEQACVM